MGIFTAQVEVDVSTVTSIFDLLPIGVFIVNELKEILYINPHALSVFDLSSVSEAYGKQCHQFICNTKQNQCPVWDLNKIIDHTETVVLSKTRGLVSVIKSCIPVLWAGQKALLEVFQDISRLKKLESEHDELKHDVHQYMKMSTVGTIASSVIHEINNPVSIIMGYSQLLMNSQLDDKSKGYITNILGATQRLQENVTNLGRFIKKDPHVGFLPIDIGQSILQGVRLFQHIANKKNIIVKTDISKSPITVLSGKSMIESIIINLMQNSFDAFEEATILKREIHLHTLIEDAFVSIVYKDSAGGMTEEVLANLYKPFFTTKTLDKGTGLGMHIVQSYVTQMMGSIDVTSEKGIGSIFTIKLPIVEISKE